MPPIRSQYFDQYSLVSAKNNVNIRKLYPRLENLYIIPENTRYIKLLHYIPDIIKYVVLSNLIQNKTFLEKKHCLSLQKGINNARGINFITVNQKMKTKKGSGAD